MRILAADDSQISLEILRATLEKWGHEVICAENGTAAWNILSSEDAPPLAFLDWMMPGLDGPAICEKIRRMGKTGMYLILLTARDQSKDVTAAFASGANDYITKPFDQGQLRARLNVGIRVVELQKQLQLQAQEVERARAEVEALQRLLPICAGCKKVREDSAYWEELQSYLTEREEEALQGSLCPDCRKKLAHESVRR